jgi:hypothetical protein
VFKCRGQREKFIAIVFSNTKEIKPVRIEIQFLHKVASLKFLIPAELGK